LSVVTVTFHPALDKVLRVTRLRPNEVNRVRVEQLYAGGKGNNVARALTRLGVKVTAAGFQGGYTGEFCARSLEAEGIPTAFTTCRALTRTSQLLFETETQAVYPIYEPGQQVEPDEVEALLATVDGLLEPGGLCLLCGTALIPEAYARLVALAHERGTRCWVDSSGAALRHSLAARPDLVKVNAHELAEAVGYALNDGAAQRRALAEVHTGGVPIVGVSLGANGLLATDGQTVWHGSLSMSNVVNTVGCGDSLLAGLARATFQGAGLPEMVRWGVACGAANTQVVGAGFIERDMVEQLLPRVNVRLL